MSYFLISIVISPFSIVGNTLVCVIVLSNPPMRTFTNFLLVNLAIADMCFSLLQAIGMITFKAADTTFDWPVFCRSSTFTINLVCGVSIGTLLVIAVERFFAIVKPLKFKRRRNASVYLMGLWFGVLLFMLPLLFFHWDYNLDCEEVNYNPPRRLYYFIVAILFLFLPSCVIIYCYSRIIYTLWYSSQAAKDAANQTNLERIKSRRKLARMLMVVSSIFVTSWLTVCVVELMSLFNAHVPDALEVIVHLFVNLNTAINPVVYSLHSAGFRRHLKNIGRAWLCRAKENLQCDSTFGVSNRQMSLKSKKTERRTSDKLFDDHHQGDVKL